MSFTSRPEAEAGHEPASAAGSTDLDPWGVTAVRPAGAFSVSQGLSPSLPPQQMSPR